MSYRRRDDTVALLVTADSLRTRELLYAGGLQFTTNTVVLIRASYEPQLAMQLGQQLAAAGIGVLCSYVSWAEGHQAYLVFKTTNDDRAVNVLCSELSGHAFAAESVPPAAHSSLNRPTEFG